MTNTLFVRREKCPACAAVCFKTLYRRYCDECPIRDYLAKFYRLDERELEHLHRALYILCECGSCGLIFQRDVPNDTLMDKLYEHWIDGPEHFQPGAEDLAYYSYYAQEIMQVLSFFKANHSSLRVLDFGMGWGRWALMAKAFGCDSYGTELSAKRITYARSNGIKVIQWEDVIQGGFGFDYINSEEVFEHLPEPLQTLQHLGAALRSRGILKISVPTVRDIRRRLRVMDWNASMGSRNSLNAVAPLEHINCFRRGSILAMADRANMEEVFIPVRVQYGHTVDWSGSRRIAKNVFLPLYRNVLKRQNYIFLRNKE